MRARAICLQFGQICSTFGETSYDLGDSSTVTSHALKVYRVKLEYVGSTMRARDACNVDLRARVR